MANPVFIQAASNSGVFPGSGGTFTLTATFASPVTTGSTILVMMGEQNTFSFPSSISLNPMADSAFNTYSVVFQTWTPHTSGGGAAFAFSSPVVGGSSFTVTMSINFIPVINLSTVAFAMLCVEFSGMGTATAAPGGYDSHSIFGAEGNSPVTRPINDSLGNAVNVTYHGTANIDGPGTLCALAAVDLLVNGHDFLLAFIVDQSDSGSAPRVPTADHSYSFGVTAQEVGAPNINFFAPILAPSTGCRYFCN